MTWEALQALGPCTVYDRTPAAQTVERARSASVVLTNKTVLDAPVVGQLPLLRYVGVLATGYNVVDVAAARRRGIVVTNVPNYSTASVAQLAFALLLELTHHAGHHSQTVRDGRWPRSVDFCYWDFPLVELAGLTMGLVGLGRIGQTVARIAQAFGMKAIAYDSAPIQPPVPGVRMTDLDTVFRESDVVSLHCPLTAENTGLVNSRTLSLMKPSAFLLNTARGPLVREQDLADALNAGKLAGAGVDVLGVEPPRPDNPLLSARNCVITPHVAWASQAARRRLMAEAVENVRMFLAGTPRNVVG
jgi:glycerate dehydrogenase